MPIKLNETTKKTVQEELGLKKFEDVLDKKYLDITPQTDVDRDKTKIYDHRNRGSIRINRGLFYTAKEAEERINKITLLKLP